VSSNRPRIGELLAGLSGIVLVGSLFLSWYGTGDDGCPAPPANCGPSSVSGWESFAVLDLVLLLAGLMAVATLALTITQRAPAAPIETAALTAAVGLIALVWVALRLLAAPEAADGLGVRWGWLGLAATAGLTAGAWLAMRDEGFGLRPEPSIEATLGNEDAPVRARLVGLPDAADEPAGRGA